LYFRGIVVPRGGGGGSRVERDGNGFITTTVTGTILLPSYRPAAE